MPFLLVDLMCFPSLLLLGESPSSSASDVDNLINPATLDKVPLAKRISSRQVAGNHVIVAKNRPSFVQLLNFVSIYRNSVSPLNVSVSALVMK